MRLTGQSEGSKLVRRGLPLTDAKTRLPASQQDQIDRYALTFPDQALAGQTFLLGNRGGFVLYLPAVRDGDDKQAQTTKWFGASGFGRSFFEGIQIWVVLDGRRVELCGQTQTSFVMHLDRAERVHTVEGRTVREIYFVPEGIQAFVLSLETDLPFILRPQYDMRYYQSLNTDFSHYAVRCVRGRLDVSNQEPGGGPKGNLLHFYSRAASLSKSTEIHLLPENKRLLKKVYLKDEHREKLIVSVYTETKTHSPDNAPLWERYETRVYAPAEISGAGPVSFGVAFGDRQSEATADFSELCRRHSALVSDKRSDLSRRIQDGMLKTGNDTIDTAYHHVLARFNDGLVARDAILHTEPRHRKHYYGIFAGDKYFMDVWKRDENISLKALMLTNDYESVGQILDDTWQFQDKRTGRLPQIIRAGEPVVYYSSDGTLWALHRLFEYTEATGDLALLGKKLSMVKHFFRASMPFLSRGLLPSGAIIDSKYLWETWMDTPFTPRSGYPVEIEMLWLTVLDEFLPFVRDEDSKLADLMEAARQEGAETFRRFMVGDHLADSISYDWEVDTRLTPNGWVAFGLGFPLDAGFQSSMVRLARDQLAGERGVRSLAPRDWPRTFPPAFIHDPKNVKGKAMASVGIYNYHRGIEWEWFNPYFVQAELNAGDLEEGYRLYVRDQACEAVDKAGIGGLSELHDMHGQVGADFQAWSMAGYIHSLHLFAGVHVDALRKRLRVGPAIPREWRQLDVRRRVAGVRFDVSYQQPSSQRHQLQVNCIDAIPAGYMVELAFRTDSHARVEASTLNEEPLPPAEWIRGETSAGTAFSTLCLTRPLEQNMSLELTTTES